METSSKTHRAGFISLVGRPNVGKSTLLNQILGQKLAIVSPKPQTTRNKILGIKTLPDSQLIFMDTPGIFKPRSKLDRRMVSTAFNSLQEVDIVLWLVEADPRVLTDLRQQNIARNLKSVNVPVFLILNKIDLLQDKQQLLPIIDGLKKWVHFAEIIPICALNSNDMPDLLKKITSYIPFGPRYFPEDVVTDQPERFLLSEIIREKVYKLTYQEIPYSCAVVIEKMEESRKENLVRLIAVIYVEHESQKGIVVGKGGSLMKKIGTQARLEMEQILGIKVYLNLWVKVRKDWRQQEHFIPKLGY